MLQFLWAKFCRKIVGKAIRNTHIEKGSSIGAGSTVVNSKIGRYSYCGYNCMLSNVQIGNFCSIADNVSIGGGTHPLDWISTSPAFYFGKEHIPKRLAKLEYDSSDPQTVIGSDVWIGKGAILKPGITVGTGAVIGMGSVVTKDIEPYSIVGGNPSKIIRKRFSDNIIEKLIESQWWEKNDKILENCSGSADSVEDFLNKFKITRGEQDV